MVLVFSTLLREAVDIEQNKGHLQPKAGALIIKIQSHTALNTPHVVDHIVSVHMEQLSGIRRLPFSIEVDTQQL